MAVDAERIKESLPAVFGTDVEEVAPHGVALDVDQVDLRRRSCSEASGHSSAKVCISGTRNAVRARTGNHGQDWYIIKPIVAGPGDHVDTTGAWLVINNRRIERMPSAPESESPALPVWRGFHQLAADEFFVFSDRIPNSFDSLCYGPISRGWIDAVRKPVITR